jgi:hypothetical protein
MNQLGQSQKIIGTEVRSSGSERDEHRRFHGVRPTRGQRPQPTALLEKDTILAPRLAVREQLKPLAAQRVKRVRHPE